MSERPKTLQHMQQLMAVAALAACKREGGSTATADAEPTTTPTTTGAQPIDAGVLEPSRDAEAVTDASADAPSDAKKVVVVPTVDIVHSTPRHHPTYHVVDMLPPPATVTPKKSPP